MKRRRLLFAALVLVPLVSANAAPEGVSRHDHTSAVTSKLTAPLAIETRYDGEPAVGQPLVMTLTLTAAELSEAAELSLSVRNDGLMIVEPAGIVQLGTLNPDEPVTLEVTVLPLAGGTQVLRVNVAADIDGRRQNAGLPIPIRLPEDTLRESAGDEAGKSESGVRSLRAVEEIR